MVVRLVALCQGVQCELAHLQASAASGQLIMLLLPRKADYVGESCMQSQDLNIPRANRNSSEIPACHHTITTQVGASSMCSHAFCNLCQIST